MAAYRRHVRSMQVGALAIALGVLTMLPVTSPQAQTSAATEQPPYWGDTCSNVTDPDRDGFTSHAELGPRLEQIALASGGAFYGDGPAPQPVPPAAGSTDKRVVVDVAGYSVHGREIYRARVGHGPRVALIDANMHGNEKHGMEALQNVLEWLGTSDSVDAKLIRQQLTVVAVPMTNPDGSTLDRRQNDQPWSLIEQMHPQIEGAEPVWYYNSRSEGLDLNRDFNVDFSYEPTVETLPPQDGFPGSYLSTESRTLRDVYAALEQEFGEVELFVNLHNQGACTRDRSNDQAFSHISISGWFGPDYPRSIPGGVNETLTKQANVAVYDAYQRQDNQWRYVTRYQESLERPASITGVFGLHGSATILMETSGQTQQIGTQFKEFLVRGVEIGTIGVLSAFADRSVYREDPDRYDDIQHKNENEADVQVTQSGPRAVRLGDEVTYTVTVTNDGPMTANRVRLSDTLPPNMEFVAASDDGTHDPATNTVTWWNAPASPCYAGCAPGYSIPAGTRTFTVTAKAIAPGRVQNTVSASTRSFDPRATNNSNTLSTRVLPQIRPH